jgi:hypothetical protein
MPNLSKFLGRATRVALRAAGDLAIPITWRKLRGGTYDVESGKNILAHLDTPMNALKTAIESAEAQREGVSNRALVLVIGGDQFEGVNPREGDQALVEGQTYTVRRIRWQAFPAVCVAIVDL